MLAQEWKPKKIGDEGAVYRLRIVPQGDLLSITSAQVLTRMRPAWMFDRLAL
mgnify:CR=1 FL=1